MTSTEEGTSSQLTTDQVTTITNNMQSKQSFQFLSFGGQITQLRALVYGLMCGKNGFEISENEFIAGCARFGLDNPTPIITRRLATYGNEEAVEKMVERMAR